MWVQVAHTGTKSFACRQCLHFKTIRCEVSHATHHITLRVSYQDKMVTEGECIQDAFVSQPQKHHFEKSQ